jgi:hypothetical protein
VIDTIQYRNRLSVPFENFKPSYRGPPKMLAIRYGGRRTFLPVFNISIHTPPPLLISYTSLNCKTHGNHHVQTPFLTKLSFLLEMLSVQTLSYLLFYIYMAHHEYVCLGVCRVKLHFSFVNARQYGSHLSFYISAMWNPPASGVIPK